HDLEPSPYAYDFDLGMDLFERGLETAHFLQAFDQQPEVMSLAAGGAHTDPRLGGVGDRRSPRSQVAAFAQLYAHDHALRISKDCRASRIGTSASERRHHPKQNLPDWRSRVRALVKISNDATHESFLPVYCAGSCRAVRDPAASVSSRSKALTLV